MLSGLMSNPAIAAMVAKALPPLPDDGQPITDSHTRRAYATILASLELPPVFDDVARKYLRTASDIQLRKVTDHVMTLACALEEARMQDDPPRYITGG